jgi:hypothetical protein
LLAFHDHVGAACRLHQVVALSVEAADIPAGGPECGASVTPDLARSS